jgi:hypothetical protein
MARIRSQITYANVVATIALFVALGGTATAALVITGKNVKNGSLTGADVKNNSIQSVDVANLRATDFASGALPAGPPGPPGQPGAAGKDATPADFAGEPTISVAAAPGVGGQCSAVAQFCTGSNGWSWRNYGNGYQAVGFWKDRGGVVHLEGVAELFGGAGGGQPAVFILPPGYRPAATRQFPVRTTADTLRYVDVTPAGEVKAVLGGAGTASLDGITFRP